MSKKLAAGAQAIVLDVKVGDGAFMRSLDEARALAEAMLELGEAAGREVVCLLTDMDQPLGRAVGNALEIREAVATLRGEGPPDFTELVLDACARLLALSDLGIDVDEGRRRAEAAVADGSALELYRRWIAAQGGDPEESVLPAAPVVRQLNATRAGYVERLSAIARRAGGAPSRRRPPDEGRRDRPRRRDPLPCQARRSRRRRSAPGGDPRSHPGRRGWCRGRAPRRLRARRRGAA